MSDKREVLLYSGGLDSFLTFQYLKATGHHFDMVYFDTGARCCDAEKELLRSKEFIENIGEVEIRKELYFKDIEQEDAFIPNRNILACICAQGLKNYDVIYLGNSLSDRVNDNNKTVCDMMGQLLSQMYDKKIEVTSPFFNIHKCELFSMFMNNGFGTTCMTPNDISQLTFSCYNPLTEGQLVFPKPAELHQHDITVGFSTRECGECPACFRKRVAMCFSYRNSDNYYVLPMKESDKAKAIINRYMDEAMKKMALISVNDEILKMKPRFESTIRYVVELRKRYEFFGN